MAALLLLLGGGISAEMLIFFHLVTLVSLTLTPYPSYHMWTQPCLHATKVLPSKG